MPNGSHASGIGNRLRDARLARGLSVEEIAWRTRIRPEYLRALESEAFDDLGHPAFVRTHLRSYAGLLGLDPAAIEDEFRRMYEPPEPSPLQTLHRRQREVSRQRPKLSWMRAAIAAVIVLTAAAAAGVLRGPGSGSDTALPPAGRLDGPAQASRDGGGDRPLRAAGADVASTRVRLDVAAVRDAWIRVAADGQVLFEGVLPAGWVRTFEAAGRIQLQTRAVESLRLTSGGIPFRPGRTGAWTGTFGPSGPIAAG